MILYMYIAPGQGQTIPWGENFHVNRNSLSLCPFVASLKKISLKADFLPFLCVFFIPGFNRQLNRPVSTHKIKVVNTGQYGSNENFSC